MEKTARIERRRHWADQVERWRESGLTQRQFCKNEGLPIERFGAWKRRLERESQSESSLVAVPPRIVSSALFTAPALRLVVDERYRVEIPDSFSASTLETVLQVLSRL